MSPPPVGVPLSVLTTPSTPEQELAELLAIAAAVQLPTTSWVLGEPTLTLLEIVAQRISMLTQVLAPMAAGGFLDFASGSGIPGTPGWLDILGQQTFNESRITATFAQATCTLTNSGGDTYVISANELVAESSVTGKTYRNSTPSSGTVTLSPSSSITLTFVADEAGSASSAGTGDISLLVTALLGVTITNPTAATGLDEESDDAYRARCKLKVPAISLTAAAPEGKYVYFAITPSVNGGANCNRAICIGDTTTGNITVVCAGPSGAISGGDVTLITAALVNNVIGPVETLSVVSASNLVIAVTSTIWVYSDVNLDSPTLQANVLARLQLLFAVAPIGGWKKPTDPNGKVWNNLLGAVIRSVSTRVFEVELSVPSSDTACAAQQVPVLGAVSTTVVFVTPPATGGTV